VLFSALLRNSLPGNEEPCQFDTDFKGLTSGERQEVLKDAKRLLQLQRENAMLADAPPPNEAEKG
jgi:hypothetical protein